MGDLPWGEFGISGVVIAALFFLVFKIVTILNDREMQYRSERQDAENRHRDERLDWQTREDLRTKATTEAIERLSSVSRG